MSYCRFGEGDVYVFMSVQGHLECSSCWLAGGSQRFDSTDALIAHLREHQQAGHRVPDDTFVNLEADRRENDAWIAANG